MLEEVEQSMVIMDSYFDQITKLGEVLNVVIVYPEFCSEMKDFQNQLEEIKSEFSSTQECSSWIVFNEIKQKIFHLKEMVDSSTLMKPFSLNHFHRQFDLKFNHNIELDSFKILNSSTE